MDEARFAADYDPVADEYAARISGELEHKPLDRAILDDFAGRVRANGPACDVGCGPGHVTRYLHDRGLRIEGVDLSGAMVEAARARNPEIAFSVGDMRALPADDGAFGGVVAFYSIIHVPRSEVATTLSEWRRVLRPGGLLLLAFHIGDDVVHLDDWWGRAVSVDFVFFRAEEMRGYLIEAGFRVVQIVEREPYPDVEHPSRRAYILAENP